MSDMHSKATEEFEELLDAYGADLSRWPPERRVVAERLLDSSPEAKQLYAEASWFDRHLSQRGAEPEVPAGMIDNIVARALASDSAKSATSGVIIEIAETRKRYVLFKNLPVVMPWPAAASLAICLASGLLFGLEFQTHSRQTMDVSAMPMASSVLELW